MIANFKLDADSDVPKFGLGMKEIWDISPENHNLGRVVHTAGWPLGSNAGGGSFIYHMENNQLSIGFVVHLNYRNPHLFPYMEFQRFKHHPMVAGPARRRKARCLRGPRNHRRRLAIDPQTRLSGRCSGRLRGRPCQCPADKGQSQCNAERHGGGGAGFRRQFQREDPVMS